MKHHCTLVAALSLQAGVLLPAQIWNETGDAGERQATAQVPLGFGPLTAIHGSVGGDADVFLLEINDPAQFSASTVGGAAFDTQLFLFDANGRGITMRDDTTLNTQSSLSGFFVPARGRYWLAISAWDNDPLAAGGEIWFDDPTASERMPDGPRKNEAFDAWSGTAVSWGSNYTIALTGCSFASPQVVLPDSHHLSENPSQLGSSGSTNWWRAGGGRFQLLYEGSHFTAAGVAGPITLTRLRFRGEDGEPNLGGISWAGAVVQLGATSLTAATMSTTFAQNRSAATTTLGPIGTTTVATTRSLGGTPNDDNLVLDLPTIAAGFPFDPTGARPNLLIDITLPNAAVVPVGLGPMMAMQDTTGGVASVRGRGVTTDTPGAATGTDSTAPLVVAVDFLGAGGNRVVTPARNEAYGAACGGAPSSFYQAFVNGQAGDLVGLRFVPDNPGTPTRYTVDAGTTALDVNQIAAVADSVADDALVTHALPFTFRYPGGSTTTIRACTNGFLWLDGLTSSTDFAPSVAKFLGAGAAPARLAPLWHDFHCGRNTSQVPAAGLHVVDDVSGGPGFRKCYVTWYEVGLFNQVAAVATASYRLQCVLGEDGSVEFRYGALPRWLASTSTATGSLAALTGFTRGSLVGSPSVDPQSRDLSLELPFSTFPEGAAGNLGLTVVATPVAGGSQYGGRAFAGQSLSWNATGLPAGTVLGAQLLDIAPARPGLQLPGITTPGCLLSTTPNATLWEVQVLPGSSVVGSRQLAIPAGFDGLELDAQYVVLDGLFGGPSLITAASNAVRTIVGRR